MEIVFIKGMDKDYINAIRDDGTVVKTTFPKKGSYPHDAVHVIVEKHFGLCNGFWGIVAKGMAPEDVGALAKECGHASSKRADIPNEDIHDLLVAERAVECFEAEMWSEPSNINTFKSVLEAACTSSHVSLPNISDQVILDVRKTLETSFVEWKNLAIGEHMTMQW